MLFGKKKYKNEEILDPGAAGQMLQNIFDVCEVEPNTVPLEVLESYSHYRKDRFFFQKLIIVIMMLLFAAIPILFMGPTLKVQDNTTGEQPAYTARVQSTLPVSSVIATIDGERMPVYETKAHVYSIEPTKAGEMKIRVTSMNRQYAEETVIAKSIDKDTPVIASNEVKGTQVYLYVTDDTGIAFDKIYAEDESGNRTKPVSYNKKTGLVIYDYPATNTNIYIPDTSGNTLHLILTVNK